VVVPGAPDDSLLIQAIRRHGDGDMPPMPPKGELTPETVRGFETWVRSGAPWPETAAKITAAVRRHWAFQPLQPATVPQSPDASAIDRFLTARQHAAGVSAVGPAQRRAFVRRTTFDLTGLPPTPAEVAAFEKDDAPGAYERLVDRLLASPHYGERWGRHWLDVVRYADTAGETADFPAPLAWRYRNYVIDAFNRDKPFDVFLREQVSGDILAHELRSDAPPERYAELVTATGYLAIARRFGFDADEDHYLTIDDTIDVLGKSVLGLSIGCARCHDHKYDPVSAADYYALYGIFSSTRYAFPGCEKKKAPRDLVPLDCGCDQSQGFAYAVVEGTSKDARIQRRGNPQELGPEVPRRFLELYGSPTLSDSAGSGRRDLAEWLTTGPASSLAARVIVNRIWQGHFGTGLVDTPNDFGTRGNPPSHPELLEWLASRFVASGWSIKGLHRDIMRTDAYRRSSESNAKSAVIDPADVWLWRFPRRRLSAEEIRDAMLMVSGELDLTPGAAHPFPPEKEWTRFTQHAPFYAVYDHSRRSVYLMTQRIKRHPLLGLFDGADPSGSTGRRFTTTVPTQALYFLNDPFVHEQSAALARSLEKLPDDATRLNWLYRVCFGRPATDRERARAAAFLDHYGASHPDAWAAWVRVQFCSNEFIYVD
jgi:hypothetical protein